MSTNCQDTSHVPFLLLADHAQATILRNLKEIPTDPEQRRLVMREIVRLQMEKHKAQDTSGQIAIVAACFFKALNSLVKDFLQSCPPAGLALSGLCVIAEVSLSLPLKPFLCTSPPSIVSLLTGTRGYRFGLR